MNTSNSRIIDILLVDDSLSDALLTKTAFEEFLFENRVHHVLDGEAALAFLRGEGDYLNAPRPDLVLLDWYLPRMDGESVVAQIRGDASLADLVVIVLSSMTSKNFDLPDGCDGCITKPVQMPDFANLLMQIPRFFKRL